MTQCIKRLGDQSRDGRPSKAFGLRECIFEMLAKPLVRFELALWH